MEETLFSSTDLDANDSSTGLELTSFNDESSLEASSLVKRKKTVVLQRQLQYQDQSDEDRAGIISTWLMLYLTPLLKLGASKHICQADCGIASKIDSADYAKKMILKSWGKELERCEEFNGNLDEIEKLEIEKYGKTKKKRKRKTPNLNWAVLEAFGLSDFCMSLLYYFISTFCMFVPVLLLEDLVQYFEAIESNDTEHNCFINPWLEAVGLGIFPVIVGILQTRSQVTMAHFATFVRTAVSTLVFQKSLSVSPTAKVMASSGKVFNLMSNDAVQLQRITLWLSLGLSCPMLVLIALVLIYRQVGRATWVGVGTLILSMPLNAVLWGISALLRRKVLKHTDDRVNTMNELLNGIRIIKFYAWEKPFTKIVSRSRSLELKYLTYMAYIVAFGFSIALVSIPIILPIVVFYSYTKWESIPLSASKAFSTLTLFSIMRFPFVILPLALIAVAQCFIASKRIKEYLMLPDRKTYVVHNPNVPEHILDRDSQSLQKGSIIMRNSSFSWIDPNKMINKNKNGENNQEDTKVFTLNNISCKIEAGKLVAIVGKVGSGKSSFLSSILGEMEAVDDSKVYIPGGNYDQFLSYCPQTPWVTNDTIKGNIVFNRTFNEERYHKVLHVSALVEDLAALPAGDLTVIGERGINLSGGQKARVAFARALYSKETKLMLLDDPLSAVDAHVGDHLFSRGICGELVKNVTRILVTHHVKFLPRCDNVIVLEGGEIKHYGSYKELVDRGVDFQLATTVEETTKEAENAGSLQNQKAKRGSAALIKSQREKSPSKIPQNPSHNKEATRHGEVLMSEEERDLGAVDLWKYSFYIKSGGLWSAFGFFLSQLLGRAAEIVGGFWLAHWSNNVLLAEKSNVDMSPEEITYYVNIFSWIGVAGIIFLTARSIFQSFHRLHASTKMHNEMLHQILRAPISFFDVTPIGRILNRFSTDLDKIDLGLPMSVLTAGNAAALVIGSLVAVTVTTQGAFLIPFIPLLLVYLRIQKWFRKTSTELQRLQNINNSPIFSDFSQTLSGTAVIRAYRVEDSFLSQTQRSFDKYNVSFVLFHICTNWLSLRLDVLGGIVQTFIAVLALATIKADFVSSGLLGLSLSFSIEATTFLKQGVRSFSKLEADMSSVERILYYSSDIPEEAPDVIPGKDPDSRIWPKEASIDIVNVCMRYRDGPLILKNINITIKGGEKIGVIGRTGSGKSSLVAALFRMTEIESGQINIDGVNIAGIGTDVLRQSLSIIPQDPVMFSNTVRYNIDPLRETSDERLWEILRKVELAEFVADLPSGLDEKMMEEGDNFSQGQKQLLCIARSMLRNTKILIMDEATASIDNTTDALIQKTIRQNFSDATVITIAHRLNTIMDSDRVLVLDSGMVAEFDTPVTLMSKEVGLFKDFVKKNSLFIKNTGER